MSEPVVYLAGPVAEEQDGGKAWRNSVISRFEDKFAFRNPLDKYNVPVEGLEIVPGTANEDGTVGVVDIVEGDKDLLRQSDGVLVGYTDVQSIGTPMEVIWAHQNNYPIALWIRDGTPESELSPWYRYHADIITTEPEAGLQYIQNWP